MSHPLLRSDAQRRVVLTDAEAIHLPAYRYEGVGQVPLPVFRWKRGQHIDQTLLDLNLQVGERILTAAPSCYGQLTMRATAYVSLTHPLPGFPADADIVCLGLWVDASQASLGRVLCMKRTSPDRLCQVLELPTAEEISALTPTHLTLFDSGLWLLGPRAAERLAAGAMAMELLAEMTDVRVVPLGGATYHPFDSTSAMLASTYALQNAVQDQRIIPQLGAPRIPSLFTQNSLVELPLTEVNTDVWIENSHVPATWTVSRGNVITGVPVNHWTITLKPCQCLRVLPIGASGWAVTVYDYRFASVTATRFAADDTELEGVVTDLLATDLRAGGVPALFNIPLDVNHERLQTQRRAFLSGNLSTLASNQRKSVFYQIDLDDAARKWADHGLQLPAPLAADEAIMTRVRDAMFRSRLLTLRGEDGTADEQRAFALLREGLAAPALAERQQPRLDVCPDQIVWGRSAVRIDVAGGWTDTPPYCLNAGGAVVNLAVELNGQQPLQVYVKPCREPKIICRSIDLGAAEEITTYDDLRLFNKVGSPFSIPKAALALCGFLPEYSADSEPTLRAQLEAFGCGIEITLLSAIPAGSGLGTSSILAATVLGALSDFCGLGWDKTTICNRTLVLEQLLTAGGGWQDQYGGVLHGVKLLQTGAGFDQTPVPRWLPTQLWDDADNHRCHLLYYTGLTRTAKDILAEIVRGMFLNSSRHLTLLDEMKQQALDMFDTIQRGDLASYGRLVRLTWQQNKALDAGTEPPLVAQLCSRIDDLCSGYKLPGAGGGGYLYMVAKDPEAAARIKRLLTLDPISPSARFVEMTLSTKGLQVSRS